MLSYFKTIMPAFVIVAMLASCSSKSDPIGPDTSEPAEVGIESFGFFEEDNQNILFGDYVIDEVTGTEILIKLPAETDLTELVARFTTTENDTVKIQNVIQESGVTANDFTNAVEYLVTEGDANEIYTVTVVKMARAQWSEMPAFTDDELRDISLAINPVSSTPSVAFISNRDAAADRKLNLISFEGGSWKMIGKADFTPAQARTVYLAYDDEGVPYVSFSDENHERHSSVMSYSNGSWSYVGGSAFSGVRSNDDAVAVGEDGTVYGFYIDRDDRGTKLKTFDGSWVDVTITGRTGDSRVIQAKQVNGDIYLAVLDFGNSQSVSVYKYSDGSWEVLADGMKESPDNVIYYYDLGMDVDHEGNVYLAYAENAGSGTDYELRVKKYSDKDDSWSTVGSTIATSNTRVFDVAVDAYGVPMLFYQDDSKNPTVVRLDEETNNWAAADNLANGEADELHIEAASNGVVYASFTVNNQLRVFKYDSPDNN